MRLVGLTGGIGSGKSSVSERLAVLGAEIIDADAIVRELQEPGRPVFVAMVERWGERILREGSSAGSDRVPLAVLDRALVAELVFSDQAELMALESMVHPAVKKEIGRRVDFARETDRTLILDNPLLVKKVETDPPVTEPPAAEPSASEPGLEAGTGNAENVGTGDAGDGESELAEGSGWPETSALIVVDCPIEVAIGRLMEFRGFSRQDADKRVAAQASREHRLSQADFVVDNGGDLADLDTEVARCWAWLQTLSHT